MRIVKEEDPGPELQMAPMIDIVFLLLTFFLVASSLRRPEKEQDLSVRLPKATQGEARPEASPDIVINVRDNGLFVVDGRVVTVDELSDMLGRAKLSNAEQGVIVRGDRRTQYENVATVLDCCARVGIENVSLATLRTEAEGQ